tara:strand:+ start:15266 stop:15715 length:450 start_codon:yes stop_codon:yes gene_type:complete
MSELAARNGQERADALLRLTRRLTDLIENETQLFRLRRPQDALALQDEKSQLANIYRAEVARAGNDPERFAGASAQAKSLLRTATERFHTSLADNARAVTALKVITEGVVRAIADEAVRQRSTANGYGPGATHRVQRSGTMPITLNQTA